MLFKDSSYLELWQPFCSVEGNHLCNFRGGYYQEQFCEIILNLDQTFRGRCNFSDFLSRALAALLFRSRTIYAILEEGIMENILVKLFEIWTNGSGDVI